MNSGLESGYSGLVPDRDRESAGIVGGRFCRAPLRGGIQHLPLVVGRAAIPQRGMTAFVVVPGLDVLKDGAARFVAGGPVGVDEQFELEGGEETFHDSIV